ncbi:MAG TPA: 1,4-dihydroxy-2-naphthoate octaprenyltransferase [Thermomicrobiales bacterium]|nr:1,4-dihydroxy-2-naphthoate octaprenyltransferase [Thermomicrobiales bacterium]
MSTTTPTPAATDCTTRPPLWKVWLVAVRPFSFTTSTVPVIAASMLALYEGAVNVWALILMLIASISTHAGCNLANDYYDDETGVDKKQVIGQAGVLQANWLTRREIGFGIIVAFAVALVAALPIMIDIGRPIVILALLSAAAAYFYTGGPFPLAYWALGEVTVFLAMGVGMVVGTYYVHTGAVSTIAVLLSVAIGCVVTAILHANNIRDREVDRQHRKRTIANLLPRGFANAEFQVLVLVPFALIAAMIVLDPGSWPIAVSALALPRALFLARTIADADTPRELNPYVRQSAGLHMQFGLLITAGYIAARLIEML